MLSLNQSIMRILYSCISLNLCSNTSSRGAWDVGAVEPLQLQIRDKNGSQHNSALKNEETFNS